MSIHNIQFQDKISLNICFLEQSEEICKKKILTFHVDHLLCICQC